ncbi:phage tail sheath family protein [Sorangium sp. So ce124]|uniref:phage tail sheath family protein n=1 Tax=Sorangium sp. So ce124 TaxID=3133280 RepID=UPI003F6398C4
MNVGINLLEVDGKATPSIQAAPTSVAGFIVRSKRGVPGKVRQVTSFADFRDYFGDYDKAAFGAYAVRGFFDNGGSLAYVTRAVATAASGSVTAATPATRDFPSAGAGATTAITVTAGYRGSPDPGAWGKGISVGITSNSDGTYNLAVQYNGVQVELWEKIKFGGVGAENPLKINDEVAGSKYIVVAVPSAATANPAPTASPAFAPLNSGGADDNLDASGRESDRVAELQKAVDNRVFDGVDVQLLCCPETHDAALVNAALTYCADRGDCMFVGHTAENADADAAKAYGQPLRGDKRYGAIYFPFIRVSDPLGGFRWIPPTGHVLGVYARTERERGIWKAPAGNAASVNNALDVKFAINDVKHTDLVKNGSVNAVRFIAGQGIVVDSSRTLSTNPLWLYVNVRLLFNFVKSSLKYGLRWVVQEPNDPTLWSKVKYNSVTPFLMGLWRRGAFGPGAPDKVFSVKVDGENNPPANIQQGIFNVEVYFYPSRPAETVIITVGQQEGGASASDR